MITYARVCFVVWYLLELTHEVSLPFEIFYAVVATHLLTRSIPWLHAKYFNRAVRSA